MNATLRNFSFAFASACPILLIAGSARAAEAPHQAGLVQIGCGAFVTHLNAAEAPHLAGLAQAAVSSDEVASQAAIEQLRAAGPSGLEALLALSPTPDSVQAVQSTAAPPSRAGKTAEPKAPSSTSAEPDPAVVRWRSAVEAVAAQRDAVASRLFWYTDFNQAQAAAKESGKPILSLHLLGRLTDEYSCANSRFFRTVLYANQEVSQRLRERFVLHWNTVRQVPCVTIDFGDGRKLKRTITGNSIHYVLDSRGQIVDALPGLYGPKAFLRALDEAEAAARETASLDAAASAEYLRKYHQSAAGKIKDLWRADLQKLGALAPADAASGEDEVALERRSLDHWPRIAGLHAEDAKLDAASIDLVRRDPPAVAAGALAMTKRKLEDPLLRVVAEFQISIGLDTVRNEYLLHRKVHQWLAEAPQPELAQFNGRVYADLFLMPLGDPWLGLAAPGVYSGLPGDGVVSESASAR